MGFLAFLLGDSHYWLDELDHSYSNKSHIFMLSIPLKKKSILTQKSWDLPIQEGVEEERDLRHSKKHSLVLTEAHCENKEPTESQIFSRLR